MKYIHSLLIILFLLGCDFQIPEMNEKFGKQNFVSAISIIELYNIRHGFYPENLEQLEYLGDWDAIWLSAVRYEKLEEGYNLFVERGHMGKPNLKLPIEFKKGLGIVGTNVKWLLK
ncbi:MAG: hypothetical protein COB38_08790 [Gammaproteobacteria bacterium]|nr:MAG: hypothetical protein COB38_08790 [Gammaproteobacteria bacterium]